MSDEMLHYYSHALDEIYRLRALLAYEAGRVEADLDYASYPRSRRKSAEHLRDAMRAAAREPGTYVETGTVRGFDAPGYLRDAGAPETLTRGGWEEAVRERFGPPPERVEGQAVYAAVGYVPSPEEVRRVIGLQRTLFSGTSGMSYVQAIREVRAAFRVEGGSTGLREAKDAVDGYVRQYGLEKA